MKVLPITVSRMLALSLLLSGGSLLAKQDIDGYMQEFSDKKERCVEVVVKAVKLKDQTVYPEKTLDFCLDLAAYYEVPVGNPLCQSNREVHPGFKLKSHTRHCNYGKESAFVKAKLGNSEFLVETNKGRHQIFRDLSSRNPEDSYVLEMLGVNLEANWSFQLQKALLKEHNGLFPEEVQTFFISPVVCNSYRHNWQNIETPFVPSSSSCSLQIAKLNLQRTAKDYMTLGFEKLYLTGFSKSGEEYQISLKFNSEVK